MEEKNYVSSPMIMETVEDTKVNQDNVSQSAVMTTTPDVSKFVKPRKTRTIIRKYNKKVMPNDLCPCGSGKKFKKCCMGNGDFDGTRELTAQEMAQVRYGTRTPESYKVDF